MLNHNQIKNVNNMYCRKTSLYTWLSLVGRLRRTITTVRMTPDHHIVWSFVSRTCVVRLRHKNKEYLTDMQRTKPSVTELQRQRAGRPQTRK